MQNETATYAEYLIMGSPHFTAAFVVEAYCSTEKINNTTF